MLIIIFVIIIVTNSKNEIIKLNECRHSLNFVKLKDNKILILGGKSTHIFINNKLQRRTKKQLSDEQFDTNTVEIFDPKHKKSTYANPMNLRRSGNFNSIVLKDGRVIVVGSGYIYNNTSKRYYYYGFAPVIDIYDPKNNTWRISKVKLEERRSQKPELVELSDGTIFISSQNIYEVYDPKTDTIIKKGICPYKNGILNSINLLSNGEILISSGIKTEDNIVKSVIYYNPQKDSFKIGPEMLVKTSSPRTIVLKSGDILYFPEKGKNKNNNNDNILQLYNTKTNKFEYAGKLQKTRINPDAILLPTGKVLFIGGDLKPVGAYAFLYPNTRKKITCEIYDPNTKISKLTKRCFSKNSASSGVLIQDNKIYLYKSSPYPYDYSLFQKLVKGKIEILNVKEIK